MGQASQTQVHARSIRSDEIEDLVMMIIILMMMMMKIEEHKDMGI
jgi:hypothetical protein